MLDYAKTKIKGGNGGKGIVSFRREKYVPKGGPDGGDGGRGGNVYIVASNEVSTLLDFQYHNQFEGENGGSGGPSNKRGLDGEDLIIKVPVGSVIKINKLIADLPLGSRRKMLENKPIEYRQKMFNYKKLHKLKMRELEALGEGAINEEAAGSAQNTQDLAEHATAADWEQLAEEQSAKIDQTDTVFGEDEDTENVQELEKTGATEGHKLYKFSERKNITARAFQIQNKGQVRYHSDEIPTFDLDKEGDKIVIARGGVGGRGNARFKGSENQIPQVAEPGQQGEYVEIEVILKMVANIGIIGFPNAGKSTILSKLTAASPKIANYPFTTLEPNLGVMTIDDALLKRAGITVDQTGVQDSTDHTVTSQRLILADIPGLIEGASQGKGLGFTFLKHVERTKTLLHVIECPDVTEETTAQEVIDMIVYSYNAIRSELMQYGENLPEKKEIVVVNKIDKIPQERVKEIIDPLEAQLKQLNRPIAFISADKDMGLNGLKILIYKETVMGD